MLKLDKCVLPIRPTPTTATDSRLSVFILIFFQNTGEDFFSLPFYNAPCIPVLAS
jgi:hypothetical protein